MYARISALMSLLEKQEIKLENRAADDKNVFYRYSVGDIQFWFTQETKTGNIYSVSIVELDNRPDRFEFCVSCDEGKSGGCYPGRFTLRCPSNEMTYEEAKQHVVDLATVSATLKQIEEFFKESHHHELYEKGHSKTEV